MAIACFTMRKVLVLPLAVGLVAASAASTGVAAGAETPLAEQESADVCRAPAPTLDAKFDPATARVSFELQPVQGDAVVAGGEARAVVRIRDGKTGLPVSGRSVAAWMLLIRNAQVSAELSCAAKTNLFRQGRVTARPDVDLNASKMLVLDRNGAVAVVDPQVDFTITQMQKVIPLPGAAADWALAPDGSTLFVAIPVYGAVAVIDTKSLQVTNLLEFGKGTLPSRLAVLPDGKLATWLAGTGAIAVAAPSDTEAPRPIAFARGDVALLPTEGGLYAASSTGVLARIDATADTVAATAAIGSGKPALANAARMRALFVASADSPVLAVLDADTLRMSGSIPAEPGLSALAMTPDGLHLLAANRATGELLLIDPKAQVVVDRTKVTPQPVEIAFSHDYAYVRGLGGDHFTVVELAELTGGRIVPLNVQSASRTAAPREALADAHLIAAYGHGALVANPDERVAYYYMEGMNTPMGTVGIYTPQTQGIMTLDRGFRETQPGVYETRAIVPFGGTYDVPVVIDAEANVQCFTVSAAAPARADAAEQALKVRIIAEAVAPGPSPRSRTVILKAVDAETDTAAAGLGDVRLLAFSSSGAWQARKWARPLGAGRYAAEWSFPKPGRYGISVAVPSRNLAFADQRPLYVSIGETEPAGSAGQGTKQP